MLQDCSWHTKGYFCKFLTCSSPHISCKVDEMLSDSSFARSWFLCFWQTFYLLNVSSMPLLLLCSSFSLSLWTGFSGLGPWCAVISYDACVRLCLHSWAKGCEEQAPYFLNNECAVLRDAFGWVPVSYCLFSCTLFLHSSISDLGWYRMNYTRTTFEIWTGANVWETT